MPNPDILDYTTIRDTMLREVVAARSAATDINIRSTTYALISAVAAQLAEAYADAAAEDIDGIDSIISQYGYVQRDAQSAVGIVKLTFASTVGARTIPTGTTVRQAGTQRNYLTTSDVAVPGSTTTAAVPVMAGSPGVLYNAAAGLVNELVGSIAGFSVSAVSNLAPITGGTERETRSQLRARFQQDRALLLKSSMMAIQAAARSVALTDVYGIVTEQVTQAAAYTNNTAGTANVYIHNGTSTPASSPLITAVTNLLTGTSTVDGYVAIGIQFTVLAADLVSVNITYTIITQDGTVPTGLITAVNAALDSVFANQQIGQPLYRSAMIEAIASIPFLSGVVDITASPVFNANGRIDAQRNQVFVPGTYSYVTGS